MILLGSKLILLMIVLFINNAAGRNTKRVDELSRIVAGVIERVDELSRHIFTDEITKCQNELSDFVGSPKSIEDVYETMLKELKITDETVTKKNSNMGLEQKYIIAYMNYIYNQAEDPCEAPDKMDESFVTEWLTVQMYRKYNCIKDAINQMGNAINQMGIEDFETSEDFEKWKTVLKVDSNGKNEFVEALKMLLKTRTDGRDRSFQTWLTKIGIETVTIQQEVAEKVYKLILGNHDINQFRDKNWTKFKENRYNDLDEFKKYLHENKKLNEDQKNVLKTLFELFNTYNYRCRNKAKNLREECFSGTKSYLYLKNLNEIPKEQENILPNVTHDNLYNQVIKNEALNKIADDNEKIKNYFFFKKIEMDYKSFTIPYYQFNQLSRSYKLKSNTELPNLWCLHNIKKPT